jgi:hypothetical protein
MQIPILIEPIEGDRYRARAGEPFAMSAEGDTKMEAYKKLEEMIFKRLQDGGEVFTIEVQSAPPYSLCAGSAKDKPFFDQLLAAIAENRRREDAEDP